MNKISLTLFVAFTAVILVGGTLLLSSKPGDSTDTLGTQDTQELPKNIEYYWGDGCPHCAVVAEFLENWSKKDEINIEKLETWSSPANARKLTQRASYCNLRSNQVGVPFLFTPKGECIIGDQPIIDHLKSL